MQMNVLAQQNYLRLDPNVMHYSAYAAGLHLARLGRPETVTCINGLRQYGIAYEDALDQAPASEAPSTEVPSTEVPSIEAPSTEAPADPSETDAAPASDEEVVDATTPADGR